MKLDLRPMLRGEVSRLAVDFVLEDTEFYKATILGDVKVSGEIVDTAGYMRMNLSLSFDYEGECARCLSPVRDHFETEFERTVVNEGTLTNEQLEEDVDEYAVISGGFLDIDEALAEAIFFDFPSKLLCSEDCRGLCPNCGKPLGDGECGCQKKEIDPRWAALKGFFDDNEEDKK